MHFTKMHGLGNDCLYVYGEVPPDVAELSRRLSDRHFGAGSDGMIYICPSDVAEVTVHLDGGDLRITVSEDRTVTLAGPAETVYEGEVQL